MHPGLQRLMAMIGSRGGGIGGGITPSGFGGFGKPGAGMFGGLRGAMPPAARNGALPVRGRMGRTAFPRRLNVTPSNAGTNTLNPAVSAMGLRGLGVTPSNSGGNNLAPNVSNFRPSFTNPNGNLRIGNSNRPMFF